MTSPAHRHDPCRRSPLVLRVRLGWTTRPGNLPVRPHAEAELASDGLIASVVAGNQADGKAACVRYELTTIRGPRAGNRISYDYDTFGRVVARSYVDVTEHFEFAGRSRGTRPEPARAFRVPLRLGYGSAA